MEQIFLVIKESYCSFNTQESEWDRTTTVVKSFATFKAAEEFANEMRQNAKKKNLRHTYEIESIEFENR